MASMTPRQRRFVECYLGNAGQAARAAGYKGSDVALRVTGHRLLQKPTIIAAIRARHGEHAKPQRGSSLSGPGDVAPEASSEAKPASPTFARDERLALLASIARNELAKDADRIRAIEIAARMEGDFVAAQNANAEDAVLDALAQVVVWMGNERGPNPEACDA